MNILLKSLKASLKNTLQHSLDLKLLDKADSLDKNIEHSDIYHSDKTISDQQMKHLKIMLKMNKRKQRVLELKLQLKKLY
ncbi:hypothetical protein BDBG_17652 [Blastomyces gilchristii SLH14081]|uniref:Uncharacterized protein n=1 Tax=Blastomyces gilchristii (strain SLH14081) TaxID=559298 RepID=A0A179UYS5_BLAGS|nr:uncharacterized protein BDBG_17652 [Blastomyces gilchristii SLH14081]OAT12288.1 hypothetical protein BDBG_17652 [Blastomyces gilchristii SLH14081]